MVLAASEKAKWMNIKSQLDAEKLQKMEAHKVKYGTRVRVTDGTIVTPPSSIEINTGDVITMLKPDGMYCKGENKDGDRVYISAWTDVEEI